MGVLIMQIVLSQKLWGRTTPLDGWPPRGRLNPWLQSFRFFAPSNQVDDKQYSQSPNQVDCAQGCSCYSVTLQECDDAKHDGQATNDRTSDTQELLIE